MRSVTPRHIAAIIGAIGAIAGGVVAILKVSEGLHPIVRASLFFLGLVGLLVLCWQVLVIVKLSMTVGQPPLKALEKKPEETPAASHKGKGYDIAEHAGAHGPMSNESARPERSIENLAASHEDNLSGTDIADSIRTGNNTSGEDILVTDKDRQYMLLAIREAEKSRSEDDRVHPKVGVVVVKEDTILATAFRGETEPGRHAEYVALEQKLSSESLVGATVYTTLEPCTTRKHPKVPCSNRLVDRRIDRVVIGMLDPDKRVHGNGCDHLRKANIQIALFPGDLMSEVEELNRDFIRDRTSKPPKKPPAVTRRPAGKDRVHQANPVRGPAEPELLLSTYETQLSMPPGCPCHPDAETINTAVALYAQSTRRGSKSTAQVTFEEYSSIAVLLSGKAGYFLFWTVSGTLLEQKPELDSGLTEYEADFLRITAPTKGKVRLVIFRNAVEAKKYCSIKAFTDSLELRSIAMTINHIVDEEEWLRNVRRKAGVEAEFKNSDCELYFTDRDRLHKTYPINQDFEFGFVQPHAEVGGSFIFQSPFSSQDQYRTNPATLSITPFVFMNGDPHFQLAVAVRDACNQLKKTHLIIPPNKLDEEYPWQDLIEKSRGV